MCVFYVAPDRLARQFSLPPVWPLGFMTTSAFYSSYLAQNPQLHDFLMSALDGAVEPEKYENQLFWLQALVGQSLIKDRHKLHRGLPQQSTQLGERLAEGSTHEGLQQPAQEKWLRQCLMSITVAASRHSCLGVVDDDIPIAGDLPVGQHADAIRELLNDHQVLVVAGETGSGKTTQLPKICAQLGRGVHGRIGHTQPRRLAARTVAARIADELSVDLGEGVGYQFRFESKFEECSRIKLMTDGILLAAINRDRLLLEYDTLIIDEAHERSLTIDFLLGYLKTILPKRPDLKIIITSATIDVQRFSEYFDNAPIHLVEGRSFPVTQHYFDDELEENGLELDEKITAALEAITEQEKEESGRVGAKDVLVFLPGEREIREVRQSLQDRFSHGGNGGANGIGSKGMVGIEVLPLYARLSRAEQNKLFDKSSRSRRVVLATNVAETSITVPNIGYVIDSGLARVSRYSARSKLQRLQVEKISQASANQRAGRCGRVAKGHCYRLYSEQDFEQRPEFTDPEIVRTHLAEVILRMKYLRLGDVRSFPFIERPDARQIKVGFKTLEDIGAVELEYKNPQRNLTSRGKQLAQLAIDPRLAVMLLSAKEHQVLPQMLVIVSALAVVDPREFPEAKRPLAQQLHSRFMDKRSDFLGLLNLWHYVEIQREQLSSSKWRRQCKKEFLSWSRLREWRDVHRQLLLSLKQIFSKVISSEFSFALDEERPEGNLRGLWQNDYEAIHRSLLSGLYNNFGQFEESSKQKHKNTKKNTLGLYRGARNALFYINPGSTLFKRKQRWIIAAEVVETKKVYARTVAAIEPHWLAEELGHLLKYSYAEPFWHVKRGQVMIGRSAQLYGANVLANQNIACERYDKPLAREVFIREALVNRQLEPDRRLEKLAKFWVDNEDTTERVLEVEARLRRRDVMLDQRLIEEHYQENLPAAIWSRNTLYAELKKDKQAVDAKSTTNIQDKLTFDDNFLDIAVFQQRLEGYPSVIELEGRTFGLRYSFSPGEENDGVSCVIPLSELQTLPAAVFEWLVPGMLHEKTVAMIKVLPKVQRRALVPAPQVASDLLKRCSLPGCFSDGANGKVVDETHSHSLFVCLAKEIQIHYGVKLNSISWQQLCREQLDPLYQMRFEIVDDVGKFLAQGRDLVALQKKFKNELQENFAQRELGSTASKKSAAVKEWAVEQIGKAELATVGGIKVKAFPVLKDTGTEVIPDFEIDQAKAFSVNRSGILRIASIEFAQTVRYLKKQLYRKEADLLGFAHVTTTQILREQTIQAAIAEQCFSGFRTGLPENKNSYEQSLQSGKPQVVSCALAIEKKMIELSNALHVSRSILEEKKAYFPKQYKDIEQQLALLLPTDMCLTTPVPRMADLVRYVKAIGIRMERIGGNQSKDDEYCEKLSSYQQNLNKLLYKYIEALNFDEELCTFRWLLEELRVALFAQQLKTKVPASFSRLEKAWQRIDLHLYPEAL